MLEVLLIASRAVGAVIGPAPSLIQHRSRDRKFGASMRLIDVSMTAGDDALTQEANMPAYLISQGAVKDPERMRAYRAAVVPLIAKFEGRYIVRRGEVQVLEGHHDGRSVTIHEFPSIEAIHAFWDSAEYASIKDLRLGAADLDLWAVEGV